jgi:hypothetical protein
VNGNNSVFEVIYMYWLVLNQDSVYKAYGCGHSATVPSCLSSNSAPGPNLVSR